MALVWLAINLAWTKTSVSLFELGQDVKDNKVQMIDNYWTEYHFNMTTPLL